MIKEIVFCKDCKNRYTDYCPLQHEEETYDEYDGYDYFYTYGASDADDFFCAYGEENENSE